MKTATLTIEVPDDWKKGDGWNCPYSRDIAIGGSNFTEMIETTRRCHLTTNHCNTDNCPLEIHKPYNADGKCCRDCKWLNIRKRCSIGYLCECPTKIFNSDNHYKSKACKACRSFEENNQCQ